MYNALNYNVVYFPFSTSSSSCKALFEIILSKKLANSKAVVSYCVSSYFYNMCNLNIDKLAIKGYLRPLNLYLKSSQGSIIVICFIN